MDENRVAQYTAAEYKHNEKFMRKQGIDGKKVKIVRFYEFLFTLGWR